MQREIPEWVYVVFTAATAFGVLLQAGILLGFFVAFRKLQGKLELILSHVTDNALPLIASSKLALEDLAPKVQTISANLAEISETLKHETHHIKGSVDDVLARTRAQTARVDEMVSGTLDGISHAGATIQHGVEVPLRHLYGILNGLKAGFETLKKKPRAPVFPEDEFVDPVVPNPVGMPVVIVEEVIVSTSTGL